ncbi:hypothetical protein VNN36_08080 [Lactococcus garvieae]|uniref:hypothetical protein n=1 Tax=Lactococcus garvieae TaxID=1363 RepID=UPI0030D14368
MSKNEMSNELKNKLIKQSSDEIEKSIQEWKNNPLNLVSAYGKPKNYKEVILPDISPSAYRNHVNFMKVFEWLSMNFDRFGKVDIRRLIFLLEENGLLSAGSYEKSREDKK